MDFNKFLIALFSVSFAILLFNVSFAQPVRAEGASLYLSPTTGTFFVGSTFDVSIFVNTGGNDINAVKVDLQFDPKKLQIASPTTGKSFISVWISQPVFSNIEGTASFQGGMPSPGINTSSGLVSTITFRAVAPGEAVVNFLDSSRVFLDDGKGTDILTSSGRGIYAITIPPPEGPKIFSTTHSDQNKWYNNNSPTFSWEKEAGVTDFSYTIDQNFYGVPDDISEGSNTSVSYTNLADGIWYFHLKAKKGDVWGGISHYVIMTDVTSPAEFKVSFEPKLKPPNITSQEPITYFVTTDNLAGISHYALKLINLVGTAAAKDYTGFFVEVASPYKLPFLDKGEYQVIVRAFDAALNWRDAVEKIEVVPTQKAFFWTKSGINIWIFFLTWQKLILIVISLIVIIISIILWRLRVNKFIYQRAKLLNGVKERAKKEEEEFKKKLGQN